MALAIDATAQSTEQTASPLTWNHTCTGTNLVLIVGISIRTAPGTSTVVTAVTYNGVSMTKVREDSNTNRAESSLWFLIGPATGTHQVSATMTADASDFWGGSISFTDAHQTTPIDVHAGTTGNGTTASQAMTTVTDGSWGVALLMVASNNTITIGGGDTQLYDKSFGAVNGEASLSRASAVTTPQGSKTMSWGLSGAGDQFAISVLAVAPVGGGGGGTATLASTGLPLMGVQ